MNDIIGEIFPRNETQTEETIADLVNEEVDNDFIHKVNYKKESNNQQEYTLAEMIKGPFIYSKTDEFEIFDNFKYLVVVPKNVIISDPVLIAKLRKVISVNNITITNYS